MEEKLSEPQEQFPILYSFAEFFKDFLPVSEIEEAGKKKYEVRINEKYSNAQTQSEKEAVQDLQLLITLIKANGVRRIAHFDSIIIMDLIQERDFHAKDKLNAFQKREFVSWYNKQIGWQIEKFCMSLNQTLKNVFSIYYQDQFSNEIKSNILFKYWYDVFSDEIDNEFLDNSLSLIDEDFQTLFLNIEQKLFAKENQFSSKIRCAAFCEFLYERKYIKHTKTRLKTIITFAKQRYKMDITISWLPAKKMNVKTIKRNR